MFSVSPSLLAKNIDLSYPLTNPSIGGLIDSITDQEALKGVGLLIQKYGNLLPSNIDSPQTSIFAIVNEIQKILGQIEASFEDLLLIYYGLDLKSHTLYTNNLHAELLSLLDGSVIKAKKVNLNIFNLVTDGPTSEFIQELKKCLDSCVEKISNPINAKLLNNYINVLVLILNKVGKESFGNELLQRLLNIWIQTSPIFSFPHNIAPYIQDLIKGITYGDKEGISLVLGKIQNLYGVNNSDSRKMSVDSLNSSWWNNIDPNWWKEQE
jgi:hypothetical protein